MGHVRLKRLPASRKWGQVVELLVRGGATVADLAGASADAADTALQSAQRDPALTHSLWLLTQLPLAARSPDFVAATRALNIRISDGSLVDVVAAFSNAVDDATSRLSGRTDLGEMARLAAAETLSSVVGADLPALFGSTPPDVRLALGKLAAPDRFAVLARDFFARLTQKHLDYYLSRTLSAHVGPGKPIATVADHSAFNAALEQHCREAARIVQAFAGGWFSKTNFRGGITPAKTRAFIAVALSKITAELRQRRAAAA